MISENKRIKTKDITGKRYGKLIVLGFCEYKYSKSGHKNCYWIACAIAVMKKWYQAIV